jgi:hypothetical protein
MSRRILFGTLFIFIVAGHLLPASARASVTYQFLGITAALPPAPSLPLGSPPHFEAFTLTTPTFLSVPTSSPDHPNVLQIPAFQLDSCLNCSFLGVFLQNFIQTETGFPNVAQIQFDDVNDVGYAYFFLPGAFSTLGSHTTAQFDALHGTLGPFENTGTLFVTVVPAPRSILLVIVGVALLVGLGARRRSLKGRHDEPRHCGIC